MVNYTHSLQDELVKDGLRAPPIERVHVRVCNRLGIALRLDLRPERDALLRAHDLLRPVRLQHDAQRERRAARQRSCEPDPQPHEAHPAAERQVQSCEEKKCGNRELVCILVVDLGGGAYRGVYLMM